MNNIQEKKLRKVIEKLVLEASAFSTKDFAALTDTEGAKAISGSSVKEIEKCILLLKSLEGEVLSLYGEKGLALIKLIKEIINSKADVKHTKRNTSSDPDPTQRLRRFKF